MGDHAKYKHWNIGVRYTTEANFVNFYSFEPVHFSEKNENKKNGFVRIF